MMFLGSFLAVKTCAIQIRAHVGVWEKSILFIIVFLILTCVDVACLVLLNLNMEVFHD
jgi:hypothetical protein